MGEQERLQRSAVRQCRRLRGGSAAILLLFIPSLVLVTTASAPAGEWTKRTTLKNRGQFAQSASQKSAKEQSFDIPAGDLRAALLAFSRQVDLQLLYAAALTDGLSTAGVKGRIAPEAALRQLLAGSGLTYRFTDTGTVTLERLAAAPNDAADESPMVLDPVVVEGARFSRSLRNTTSSVTVIDELEVERADGRGLYDALPGTPNLTPRGVSELPAIRGLETGGPGGLANTATQGTFPRAPLIVDGIARPASVANSSFSSLWDVEQVEIFRGPQSTLQGRNAIGGAFVVNTKDPTFTPEASVLSSTAFDGNSDPDGRFAGMVSGPVAEDRLALRFTAEHERGDDPREVVNVPPGGNGDEQTEFDFTRLRAKALMTPQGETGDLRLELLAEGQFGTTPQTRDTVAGPDFDDRTFPFGADGFQRVFDTTAVTTGLDGSYRLGQGLELRSLTSFALERFDTADLQSDPTAFDFSDSIFNQDITLSLGDDTTELSGLVGLNFSESWLDAEADGLSKLDGRNSTQAIFADGRYELVSGLDLLFGGRIQHTLVVRDQQGGVLAAGDEDFDDDEVVYLPKLGLSYDIDRAQTVAVTARRGFNPGGGSLNLFTGEAYTFDSETVWTFETAYRSIWLGQRLSLNATAFYNLHDDPQFFLESEAGNRFSLEVVNAGKARSYGLELDLQAQATADLLIAGGLGLLETEITEGLPDNDDVEGNEFGSAPSVTFGGRLVWSPLDELSFDADVSYVSEHFSDLTNESIEKVGDYVIVNLGASVSLGDLEMRVSVNNLTDQVAATRQLGNTVADLLPPRTFSLSLRMRF